MLRHWLANATVLVAGCDSPPCPEPHELYQLTSGVYELTDSESFLEGAMPPGEERAKLRMEVDGDAKVVRISHVRNSQEVVESYEISALAIERQ